MSNTDEIGGDHVNLYGNRSQISHPFWQLVPYSNTNMGVRSPEQPVVVIDLENELEEGISPSTSLDQTPSDVSSAMQAPTVLAPVSPMPGINNSTVLVPVSPMPGINNSTVLAPIISETPGINIDSQDSIVPAPVSLTPGININSTVPAPIISQTPGINSGININSAVPAAISQGEDFKLKRSASRSPTRDDESVGCPICFEAWSNSGPHRLVSINCGHLFGRSCIAKWLRQSNKCPQCNCPSKKSQIRIIYANVDKLKTVDTWERDSTLEHLQQEKNLRKNAEEDKAKFLLQNQEVKVQLLKLEQQRQQLQQQLQQQLAKQAQSDCSRTNQQHTSSLHKYEKQASWIVAQHGARVMAYDTCSGTLVVSKPSANQLFPGYGVVKVSSLDSRHSQYISIHDKTIRDAVFSKDNNGLLLTASVDKTLKITSIQSNTTVLSYSTAAGVWSCAWNTSDMNYIYGGLANGKLCVFDIRNTSGHVKMLERTDRNVCCPLVSLAYVPKSPESSFKISGLLTCSLQDACFWENTHDNEFVSLPLNFPQGSYTCLNFDHNTRHCLLSQRPSKNFNRTRHTILRLYGRGQSNQQEVQGNDDNGVSLCPSYVVSQCLGGTSQKLLGRSILFPSPDDKSKLFVCTGDESTKSTIVWDGITGTLLQSLPNQGGAIVMDICSFQASNTHFLACLTDENVSLYKWR